MENNQLNDAVVDKNKKKTTIIKLSLISLILFIIIIVIIVAISLNKKKPTPSPSDKTFSTFTIDNNNIPTTLTTGYTATSWTQTVSTTPTADSIDYTVTNVDAGLNGKITVNTSGSSTTGVKLDLATGVVAGTYSYTVHGEAHKSGYTDSSTDKTCSLTIGNATFSAFTIENNNIPTTLITGYSATSWTQTTSTTPTADSINYSVTNVASGLSGKLTVDSSSTVSGVKLNLATGVVAGTYAYTVHGVAHKSGYTDSTVDKSCSLTIGNGTFATFTIDNNNIPTTLITGYSATSWTQTVSSTPAADSIDYSLTNLAPALSGKLSVNTSGSSTTGVKLDLATGVVPGTYSYTVHGVAHKSGYTDSTTDKVCSITISIPSFTIFTIDNNNIPSLTTGYSATNWTQSVSTTPTADSIDYTLANVATGLSGKLTVDSSSTVSGVKLNIATGVTAGTYAYTIHGVAHKAGYTDSTTDKVCSITISIPSFTIFTIDNDNIPTSLTTGYSATNWTQTVSTTPTADSIDYTLANVATGLSGKLTVDSSSTVSDVKLNLATGVVAGTYAYTVHGVAHKSGYTDSTTDKTCSITISNGSFSAFTIDNNNIPSLTTGYSATNWTQSVSTTPTADSIDYTLTSVDTGLNGKLSVSSVATGAKLDLATGVTTGTYSYTIHGVAHKTGYTDSTTDKTCSITIIDNISCIIQNDGTIHYIDTSGTFCTDRTSSGTFDFRDTNGVDQTITRTDIKKIYLIDLQQITTAPDNYLQNMCYGMTNLTVANIEIPSTITTVGNNFCKDMFKYCNDLQSLPSNFNLPQGITGTVGDNFCEAMFRYCSLFTSLPSSFNLPQSITTVGDNFCKNMFDNCQALSSLPSGFNLSTGITTVGDSFCNNMFGSCTSFTSLPSSFNIPQSISSINDYFCVSMFYNCSSLQSLPSNFNLPQGITGTVGNQFCAWMFQSCSSLKNDNTSNLVTITIPNSSGTAFCEEMFLNCTGLTGVPATPSAGSTVQINAN